MRLGESSSQYQQNYMSLNQYFRSTFADQKQEIDQQNDEEGLSPWIKRRNKALNREVQEDKQVGNSKFYSQRQTKMESKLKLNKRHKRMQSVDVVHSSHQYILPAIKQKNSYHVAGVNVSFQPNQHKQKPRQKKSAHQISIKQFFKNMKQNELKKIDVPFGQFKFMNDRKKNRYHAKNNDWNILKVSEQEKCFINIENFQPKARKIQNIFRMPYKSIEL